MINDEEVIQHLTDIDTICEIVAAVDENDEHRDIRNAEFSLLLTNAIRRPSRTNNECLGAYLKAVCVAAAEKSLEARPEQPEDENYEQAIVMTMGER